MGSLVTMIILLLAYLLCSGVSTIYLYTVIKTLYIELPNGKLYDVVKEANYIIAYIILSIFSITMLYNNKDIIGFILFLLCFISCVKRLFVYSVVFLHVINNTKRG